MKRILTFLLGLSFGLALMAQPKVVGHRGCRYEGPFENTLAAMKIAQNAGVDAIEFDINLTADGEVIVFHGPLVPGMEKDIRDMTFAEARKVVLPGGHRMPTMQEWFRQARKHPEIRLVIEIKKQYDREKETELVRKTIDIVREEGMAPFVEYTAFGEYICDEVRRLDPKAKIIYLHKGTSIKNAAWAKEKGYDGISYDLNGFLNHPEIAAQAKELGVETTLWLVNDFEVASWAILHGIDYISTDFPEKLVPYIDAVKNYR